MWQKNSPLLGKKIWWAFGPRQSIKIFVNSLLLVALADKTRHLWGSAAAQPKRDSTIPGTTAAHEKWKISCTEASFDSVTAEPSSLTPSESLQVFFTRVCNDFLNTQKADFFDSTPTWQEQPIQWSNENSYSTTPLSTDTVVRYSSSLQGDDHLTHFI